jgi:hypothetical protein
MDSRCVLHLLPERLPIARQEWQKVEGALLPPTPWIKRAASRGNLGQRVGHLPLDRSGVPAFEARDPVLYRTTRSFYNRRGKQRITRTHDARRGLVDCRPHARQRG